MRAILLLLLLLTGCGRVGFDGLPVDDGDVDAPIDGEIPPARLARLATGGMTTCAIRAGGAELWCWGNGIDGRIGNNTDAHVATPTPAIVTSTMDALWAGDSGLCVRAADDGTVSCWGPNADGQLGLGGASPVRVPTAVAELSGSRSVSFSYRNACGFDDGQVVCAGYGPMLGDGVGVTRATFASLADVATPFAILAGGDNHLCALSATGRPRCWGSNEFGQLGAGTIGGVSLVPIDGPPGPYLDLVAGDYFTCGLAPGGFVDCWGDNTFRQLGDTGPARGTATRVANLDGVISLAAGAYTVCAVREDRSVWCWGGADGGTLGDGSLTHRAAPAAATISDVVQVASTTDAHFCALKADDTVWCWGHNYFGQLGRGVMDYDDHPIPMPVLGLP